MTTSLKLKRQQQGKLALSGLSSLAMTSLAKNSVQLKWLLLVTALVVLIVGSALGVVYSSYKSRQLFAELQTLNREAIHLEEEWGRLLLEQSTWASHSRIESVARSELKMVVPDADSIVVVEQWQE